MADVYIRLKGVKLSGVIVYARTRLHLIFFMSQSRDSLHLIRSSLGFHKVARNFVVKGVIFN